MHHPAGAGLEAAPVEGRAPDLASAIVELANAADGTRVRIGEARPSCRLTASAPGRLKTSWACDLAAELAAGMAPTLSRPRYPACAKLALDQVVADLLPER
jgi:hypothetical protein